MPQRSAPSPAAARRPGDDARAWLAATAIVTAILAFQVLGGAADLGRGLGDTDDAMRLVLVRDLLHGRGWYDQWVGRLQPPIGTYMHWSRLLDGVLAALMGLAGHWMSPAAAEILVRRLWPVSLIAPAVAASLGVARALGGRAAIVAGAALLATNPWAFVQFQPGRIDHHNVQITLTLAAAAFALSSRGRAGLGAAAGGCAALALAIGVESLAFQAIIGAGLALALLRQPGAAPAARGYGLALAAASVSLFLVQTPPGRWGLSVCDALGFNLVLALVAAGLGLALAADPRLSPWGRRIAVAAGGALAAGVYLGADPACLHGPLGAVDPRLGSFWFNGVEELKPWPALLDIDRRAAMRIAAVGVLGLASAAGLAWRAASDRRGEVATAAALVALAVLATAQAFRLEDYLFAFGLPVLAALIARLARQRPPLALILALALTPAWWARAGTLALDHLDPRPAPTLSPNARCYEAASYRDLAALPRGVVLADINLGPFILAHTDHAAIAAPYHRMTHGLLAAHRALAASPPDAEAAVRGLGADYVVECGDLIRVGPQSFEAALRRGSTPPWLVEVSRPQAALRIYRLRSKPDVKPLEPEPHAHLGS